MKLAFPLCAALAAALISNLRAEGLDAGLMRMPAVSEKQIAFVYAGDIWVAPKTGGTAIRLSTPRGEELFPRFSPDGSEIAFTGNYEGNEDIYVMPVTGGEPRRVTYHGAADRMVCWWPDGKSIVFASHREAFTDRVSQFFKINAQGGLPERLPIPYGEFAAVSPDGKTIAYTMTNTDGASWKRYRGGMAPDIWLFHLDTGAAENITHDPACDSQPMWAGGDRLYFLSDREGQKRANLWRYDLATQTAQQVTRFAEFDVRYPSIGPKEIVFENGGRLYLFDLATEQARVVHVEVVTDKATLRPRLENVGGLIRNATISPTGKRALFEARGDIFSVPAEHGIIRNLTESQGVAERYPAWSPDGKWIAYFSDRSGEYELTLRSADGKGGEEQLTRLGSGFRYSPQWSPDSRKLVFIDSSMRLWLHDLDLKATAQIDKQMWLYHGELDAFRVSWSADSRWIAYPGDTENRQSAIVLYDVKTRARRQVTSAFYDDDLPVFDPAGKFLYYRSKRNFHAIRSDFDNTWTYTNSHALVCVPLLKSTPSPLAPRNDEEPVKKDEPPPKKEDKKDEPQKSNDPEKRSDDSKKTTDREPQTALQRGESPPSEQKPAGEPNAEKKTAGASKPKEVKIDVDGFEARGVVLPVGSGRLDNITAVPGKVIFRWPPRAGSNSKNSPVSYYDLDARTEKKILDDAGAIELSADGKKLLFTRGGSWFIGSIAPMPPDGAKPEKSLPTNALEMTVDPMAEWRQMFADAWRIERDYFYDPNLHHVNWPGMRERYREMLNACVTRHDVNYVLGELLGELNSSHTYRGGGELDAGPYRPVGYLGCNFSREEGAYRIKRILDAAPWDSARSPLRAPGVNVREGDWLLAVNGRKLDAAQEPAAALQGLADIAVMLTVNDKPSLEGAREVLVQTLASENALRQQAWIEQNRRRVEEGTHGRVGYVYVRNTASDGQAELFRQWRAQTNKDGLIIDERWNSGGQIPDRFVELLNRPVTHFWSVRDGHDWTTPHVTVAGPKAMLANAWSGSGGDCFPWLFRENKLGPVIGTRTWGGLIGMTGCPPLVDGGHVTVPTFGIYDKSSQWIIEGSGVQPDIEVIDDPAQVAKGTDPQLDRAIREVLDALGKNPPAHPHKPAYTDRTR
jgi:tricorn protease